MTLEELYVALQAIRRELPGDAKVIIDPEEGEWHLTPLSEVDVFNGEVWLS